MRFFRRPPKQSEPESGSYQERLRAIGRRMDIDGLRFRILVEMPDGFLLKAEELAVRPQGGSGSSWSSRTLWLRQPEMDALIASAHRERDERSAR